MCKRELENYGIYGYKELNRRADLSLAQKTLRLRASWQNRTADVCLQNICFTTKLRRQLSYPSKSPVETYTILSEKWGNLKKPSALDGWTD